MHFIVYCNKWALPRKTTHFQTSILHVCKVSFIIWDPSTFRNAFCVQMCMKRALMLFISVWDGTWFGIVLFYVMMLICHLKQWDELLTSQVYSWFMNIFVHSLVMYVQQNTHSIHYYKTNSCRSRLGRSFQQKQNLVEDLCDKCDDTLFYKAYNMDTLNV